MTDHEPLAPPTIEIDDGTEGPTPTEPVRRGAPGTARRAPWRWVVALLVVALATTATLAGAIVLTGSRSVSTVARWAPADALVYGELRPDLPGDQRDQLAAFLSAFPGFADRSILEEKLTQVYDQLLSTASKGKQSYSADIAPWFGGQLGVALRAPATPSSTSSEATASPPPMLLVASSTDPARALAWFRSTAGLKGATVGSSEASGSQLLVATLNGEIIAAAAPEGVLLVGDEASVRAALSRGGDGGLASDASFKAAMDALPGDGLATVYVHVAAYAALVEQLPRSSAMPAPPADLASLLPAWSAATIRAGSDSLVADSAAPATSLTTTVPDGPSTLPSRLPAGTMALADVHDAGAALTAALSVADPTTRSRLESALDRVGGLQGLVGWAGETAAVVVATPAGPTGGVVSLATDAKAAAALSASLSNLATLAGLKPADTTYAGQTITTVDLTLPIANGSGSPHAGTAGAAPSTVSWTVAGDLVVIGRDIAFVKAVLDTKPGSTLADAPRFTSLAGRVPASSHALVWADLVALRDASVARMTPAERARYDADVAPYLAPLSAVIGVATHDGSLERTHGLLVVTHP
jgi:hypothetical protein